MQEKESSSFQIVRSLNDLAAPEGQAVAARVFVIEEEQNQLSALFHRMIASLEEALSS